MQRSAGKPIVAKVTLPEAEQKPHVVPCFVLAHKRLWCNVRRKCMVEGLGIEDYRGRGARVERRRTAVVEIRKHLAGIYRGFVWWVSLYGDVDDHYEKERRELVVGLHDELSTSIYRGQCGSRKVAARRSRWVQPVSATVLSSVAAGVL